MFTYNVAEEEDEISVPLSVIDVLLNWLNDRLEALRKYYDKRKDPYFAFADPLVRIAREKDGKYIVTVEVTFFCKKLPEPEFFEENFGEGEWEINISSVKDRLFEPILTLTKQIG